MIIDDKVKVPRVVRPSMESAKTRLREDCEPCFDRSHAVKMLTGVRF